MNLFPEADTVEDLATRIAREATYALMDYEPQPVVKVLAHYDALMVAFKGWERVSMLDLTTSSPIPAKDPFAWFLFRHREHGWWAGFDTHSECLSHPYTGKYLHTHLVTRGELTAAETADGLCEAAYRRATTPVRVGSQMEPPTVRDRVHGLWMLGHFDSEKSKAYQMLLALTEPRPTTAT